jgi:hypothetical protein
VRRPLAWFQPPRASYPGQDVYLATSVDLQGLIAQGRTVAETIEIVRDVARKLIGAQQGIQFSCRGEAKMFDLVIPELCSLALYHR